MPLNLLFEISKVGYSNGNSSANHSLFQLGCAKWTLRPRFIHAVAGSKKTWTLCLARILAPLSARVAFPTHWPHIERGGNAGDMAARTHSGSATRPASEFELEITEWFTRGGLCAAAASGGSMAHLEGALKEHWLWHASSDGIVLGPVQYNRILHERIWNCVILSHRSRSLTTPESQTVNTGLQWVPSNQSILLSSTVVSQVQLPVRQLADTFWRQTDRQPIPGISPSRPETWMALGTCRASGQSLSYSRRIRGWKCPCFSSIPADRKD